jgi:hypothetical protein
MELVIPDFEVADRAGIRTAGRMPRPAVSYPVP